MQECKVKFIGSAHTRRVTAALTQAASLSHATPRLNGDVTRDVFTLAQRKGTQPASLANFSVESIWPYL